MSKQVRVEDMVDEFDGFDEREVRRGKSSYRREGHGRRNDIRDIIEESMIQDGADDFDIALVQAIDVDFDWRRVQDEINDEIDEVAEFEFLLAEAQKDAELFHASHINLQGI